MTRSEQTKGPRRKGDRRKVDTAPPSVPVADEPPSNGVANVGGDGGMLAAATASRDAAVQDLMFTELANVFRDKQSVGDSIEGALGLAIGMAPRDVFEGMLIAQMVSVHDSAMRFIGAGGGTNGVSVEVATFYLNRAVRFTRLFMELADALARYRGKAPTQQKVTVEHVNVYGGGQAVVGNVTPAQQASTAAPPPGVGGGE